MGEEGLGMRLRQYCVAVPEIFGGGGGGGGG